MKTSELIDLLSSTALPVEQHWLVKITLVCAMAATILALVLVVATIGPRVDIAEAWQQPPTILKVVFGASVAVAAVKLFLGSLRPGWSPGRSLPLLAIPFVALAGLAMARLSLAPINEWSELIFGRYWIACLVFVPLFALGPLGLFIALARRGVLVRPRLTGLMAGLAAGGLAMVAYALHCPDDAVPFMSTWYPLALAVSGIVGAAVLPIFCRW